MHGQFIWYELTTPDVAGARKFYPAITGWGTQQFDKDYTMWTSGGVPYAGIFQLSPDLQAQGVPPNWMPYIESSNVDETARLAASLGGSVVVPPADIPNTGRFAVLQDPQGATFGIYRSSRDSQAWDGSQIVGKFSWHELMTTDYPSAFGFYQRIFGWDRIGEMDMGDGFMYSMYGKGQKMYGGMFNRPPEMESMRPFWLSYIFVKNVPEAVETATRRGATLVRGPMPIPGGMIAILADPQGAGFAVHHADAVAAAAEPAARQPAGKTAAKKAGKTAAKRAAAARPKRAAAKKAPKAKTSRKPRKAKTARKPSKVRSRPKATSKKRGAGRRGATRGAKRGASKKRVARRSTAKRRGSARRGVRKSSRRAASRRKR